MQAVINYQKEGISDKRQIHYTRILAVHLAAEQKNGLCKDDQMTQILFKVARGQMRQAFLAPKGDPIAMNNIRDLRFMAEIYARQGQSTELLELWEDAPKHLAALMSTHHDDLMNLKARIFSRALEWKQIEKHCGNVIKDAVLELKRNPGSKSSSELFSSRWEFWHGFLKAIQNIYTQDEAISILHEFWQTVQDAGFSQQTRANQRASLVLAQAMRVPLLPIAKLYWDHHSSTPSCFNDLRTTIENLGVEAQQEFHLYIQDQTRARYLGTGIDQAPHWEQAELNILKFDYLLTLSLSSFSSTNAKEALVAKTIKFCIANPESSDGVFLAIYALLHLHYETVDLNRSKPAYEVAPNTRVLLQATLLARHMIARDSHKANRTLALLAVRLHLNLGLGKSAFALYAHCQLKEILLETISLIVFSRISMTHPFKLQGYLGFSADEALAKVIDSIDLMELKAGTALSTNIASFSYDQALNILSLKRQLKGSLTKQLCLAERRRIARLKGQPTDLIPRVTHRSFDHILDNTEDSIFPAYGSAATQGPNILTMPNGLPNKPSMIADILHMEHVSSMVYREDGVTDNQSWYEDLLNGPEQHHRAGMVSAESVVQGLWICLRHLMMAARKLYQPSLQNDIAEFPIKIVLIRKAMQSLQLPDSTTMKPEDEPTMFSENMLLACYTKLELLRATNKLLDILRETVVNTKSNHEMKRRIPDGWIDNIAKETQQCYNAVQDVARSYINAITKRGFNAIKAQARWGFTGTNLGYLLTDEDVDSYANEYVDSALEAWGGVLKVHLK